MTTVVNPAAHLTLMREQGVISAVRVEAPVKGDALRITTFHRNQDPELFSFFLINAVARPGRIEFESLPDCQQVRLAEIGFLIEENQASETPTFSCDVNALPTDLLTKRVKEHSKPSELDDAELAELIVEPTFRMFGKEVPQPGMRKCLELSNPLRTDRCWFSVNGDLAGPNFYSCSLKLAQQIKQLAAGRIKPADLPNKTRTNLIRSGVLLSVNDVKKRCTMRSQGLALARRTLNEDRYVLLREVIQAYQLAAIRNYYRKLLNEGFVKFGDAEWPNRYFSGKDPLTYFFHEQLTELIGEITGKRVIPSFAYFTSYRAGADLKPHRDREQCHFAMSVLLDHGQPDDFSSWPFYIKTPRTADAIGIRAALGDGILYFGEELLHYRKVLTQGFSTHWFLFWVPDTLNGSHE